MYNLIQIINKQMKQNYTYLQRIYPQYSHKNNKTHNKSRISTDRQHSQQHKNRTQQDLRLQNKLKHILENLEQGIRQDNILNTKNNKKYGNLDNKDRKMFQNRLRSFSHKNLGPNKYLKELNTSNTRNTQGINEGQYYKKIRNGARNSKAYSHKIYTETSSSLETPQMAPSQMKIYKNKEGSMLPAIISKKSYKKLQSQEHQLGKKVLEKVQKHFNNIQSKKQKKYYERVKSQQNIDDSLVEYLRHKVKMANLAVNKQK